MQRNFTTAGVALPAALITSLALTACGGGSPDGDSSEGGSSEGAAAGDRQVVFSGYGGEYQSLFMEHVAKPFTEETGIEVVYDNTGANAEKYAAIRASGGAPGFDVSLLNDIHTVQEANESLLAKITAEEVPNIEGIYPQVAEAVGQYGVPIDLQYISLMYSDEDFQEPPTSWDVMWDPKYSDGAVLWNPTAGLGYYQILIAAKMAGGSPENVEPAWPLLEEMAASAAETPTTSSEVVPSIETGALSAFPYFDARADLYSQEYDYSFTIPEDDGTYGWISALGVPAKADNINEAYEFIDFWLRPEVQQEWVKAYKVGSPVDGLELPEEITSKHITSADWLDRVEFVDPRIIIENQDAWIKRWQGLFS